MKLQQFAGGLATRLAPQFLNQDQGAVYTNVDNTTGELAPVNADTDTNITIGKYNTFFVKDQEWVSSDTPTTFLEFQNVLYEANGIAPTKRSNGVTHALGIAAPTAAPTLSSENLADPIEELSVVDVISGGNLPTKALSYRLYNKKDGVLSAPLEITVDELTVVEGTASTSVSSLVLKETVNYYPSEGFRVVGN